MRLTFIFHSAVPDADFDEVHVAVVAMIHSMRTIRGFHFEGVVKFIFEYLQGTCESMTELIVRRGLLPFCYIHICISSPCIIYRNQHGASPRMIGLNQFAFFAGTRFCFGPHRPLLILLFSN